MLLVFPLMSANQSISARIRRVAGKGLAVNIKTAFLLMIAFAADHEISLDSAPCPKIDLNFSAQLLSR
jgi:hypothetical protein